MFAVAYLHDDQDMMLEPKNVRQGLSAKTSACASASFCTGCLQSLRRRLPISRFLFDCLTHVLSEEGVLQGMVKEPKQMFVLPRQVHLSFGGDLHRMQKIRVDVCFMCDLM